MYDDDEEELEELVMMGGVVVSIVTSSPLCSNALDRTLLNRRRELLSESLLLL